MKIKDVIPVDFVNYKEPTMYIAFPHCTFKCEKECGIQCCHNSSLARAASIDVTAQRLVEIYRQNAQPIARGIVCAGLEPLDSFDDLVELITEFRRSCTDPVIVYTGYREDECDAQIQILKKFSNILVKFGRFVPGQSHHIDELLGVELANPQQYAKKIS